MINRVLVFSFGLKYRFLEAKTKEVAQKALTLLRKRGLSLEIYLVDSTKMRFLNRRFRGRDQTTNVLSFPAVPLSVFYEPLAVVDKRFKTIGEIYLDPGYIGREGQILEKMLVHGLLHLFGYNHNRMDETRKMERLEEKLGLQLGF